MRKDWCNMTIGDLVSEMYLGPFGSALKVDSYVDKHDGFAIVYEQKHAIHANLNFEPHYISEDKFSKLARFEVGPGDFIMSCRGTIGKIFRLPANAPKGIIHPSVMKIRIKEDVVLPDFFKTLLESIMSRQITKGNCVQMAITAKVLSKLPVFIPCISTQQIIISELNQIKTLIEIKEKQLQELEELEQTIFHEMFGDPIDNEKKWATEKFSNCFLLKSGTGLPSKKICIGEFPIYGGNGIVGYHNVYNLEGDNIIIGRVGALCGNVRNVCGKIFVTDNAFIMTKKININNKFIQHLLTHINLRSFAHDALQPVISNQTLKNIDIILPDIHLQTEFSSKIKQVELMKDVIEKEIKPLKELLASRMQYWFD